MEISTVKAQIQQNKLQPMYIFTGNDYAVRQMYIKKLAKDKNLIIVDNLASMLSNMATKTLFNKPTVFVLYDNKEFVDNEALVERAKNGEFLPNTIVVVISQVDKRKKFYKNNVDNFVCFDGLDSKTLCKYINKVCVFELDDATKQDMIDACGANYGYILNEIDKINQYAQATGKKQEDVMDDLYDILYSSEYVENDPFVFAKSVFGKACYAYLWYRACISGGCGVLSLLGALYTVVRQVLQVQSCNGPDVAKTTGLTGWQIKNIQKLCGVYPIWKLVDIIQLIRKCEIGIKTGRILEDTAIDYLLVNIYGKE